MTSSPGSSHPFFIVGSQRSGTTMLRLMLNRHSRLHVPFESRFIPDTVKAYGSAHAPLSPSRAEQILEAICAEEFVRKGGLVADPAAVLARRPSTLSELVDAVFAEHAQAHGKVRWGDKTPSYVLDMDWIWHTFPECKFIHLVRDGRDVACSLRGLSWGTKDTLKAARDWRFKVLMGRKMGFMVRSNYLEVRFEDLVAESAHELQRICTFLGEDYEAGMLDYAQDAIDHMPSASLRWHRSSVRSPDPELVGVWRQRLGHADVRVFEEAAGDALAEFGYKRSSLPRTLRSRLRFAQYALMGRA